MTDTKMRQVRPFAELLQDHRKGLLHAEIGDELQRLVERVMETGKGGKLTLTFTVKPASKGQDMVVVQDDLKSTLPQPDRGVSFFYVDSNFNLVRNDPNQPDLPFRAVSQEAQ